MNARAVKSLLLAACLGLAACERGPSPNDEVASELRALRLALRESRPQAAAEAQPTAREAIDGALRPLRDVLTQLGSAQRELATRQSALTQELQHWTQLVVGAMQDKQAQQGRDLQQRLEQLEQTMAQQDARHREVEALMQGALDNTATHLEDFLKRLEQLSPREAQSPAPAEQGGGSDADRGTRGDGQPGNTPTPTTTTTEGASPATGTGPPGDTARAPPATRQGASRWPWWVLAAVAVVMGVRLLLPRRPAPLSVAPEMQSAPAPGNPTSNALAAAPAEAALDEPEVEELWAAAALLGEAIGKIKQSAHPDEVERLLTGPLGDVVPGATAAPHEPQPHEPEFDFDDLFVLDEEEDAEAPAAPRAPDQLAAAAAAQQTNVEPPRPALETERIVEVPRAPALLPAAEPSPSRPESITCRLAVRDAPRAAAAVRELLGTDPRVLVQPAPEVRPAAGELCVVFALLPGLPAGERSQLEQRLRDAVA